MNRMVLATAVVLMAGACDSSRSGDPVDPIGGGDDDDASVDGGVPPDHGDAGAHDGGPRPDGGTPPPPDGGTPPPDGGTPPPDGGGDGCATPPVTTYTGEQLRQYSGSGSYDRVRVEVTWTLVSSDGCVDRYQPSGRVYHEDAGPCSYTLDPVWGEIEAGDGALVIDRSTSPATYTVRGASTYSSVIDVSDTCDDGAPPQTVTVGGPWADSSGSFDGAVIAGGLPHEQESIRWDLVADDVPPPGDGCSEPASDTWATSWDDGADSATVTWTRTGSDGCVDRYAPSGTARAACPTPVGYTCTCSAPSGPVEAGDGTMIVDRTSDPATVRVEGYSTWDTTRVCTPDGGEPFPAETIQMLSSWPYLDMAFDGDRWTGAVVGGTWSFARGE